MRTVFPSLDLIGKKIVPDGGMQVGSRASPQMGSLPMALYSAVPGMQRLGSLLIKSHKLAAAPTTATANGTLPLN